MKGKNLLVSLGLIFLAAVLSAVAYAHLPPTVPTHWSASGVPDGYSSKMSALLFTPFLMTGILALFLILPAVSPKKFEIEPFQKIYEHMNVLLLASLVYFHGCVLWFAAHPGENPVKLIVGGVCILIALLGNVLGKVRKIFFIGIKTPWTLASDRVWEETHRLAGKLMFAAGLAGLVLATAGAPVGIVLIVVVGSSLYPILYSLIRYKQLQRQGAV